MQFPKITITIALAITASLPSATYALTKYDLIIKQIGQPSAPNPVPQSGLKSANLSNYQVGQTFFSHPPQLLRAAAAQSAEDLPDTYEFTLTIPKDAGQPLQAVTIAQAENLETVKFDISTSKAFVGDRLTASSAIRLASIGGNPPTKPGEATIVFEQPVQPGNTVTVALAVQQNPRFGGIYLFGVTAHPAGANGLSQFLGYGRITFYSN